jgi:hypothetical protein
MTRALLLAAGLAVATLAIAAARYEGIVLSDAKGGKPMKVFKPATAKVVLTANVKGAAKGTALKAQWIAEKVEGAPPNYLIDATELKAKEGSNDVTFSFSKPTAGWPLGAYRVELLVDGKVVEKVPFTVAR